MLRSLSAHTRFKEGGNGKWENIGSESRSAFQHSSSSAGEQKAENSSEVKNGKGKMFQVKDVGCKVLPFAFI